MAEIAGLKLIVPSSVSAGGSASASVSASGKVTFSNVTNTDTLSVEGAFSSTYTNYLIVMTITGGGGDRVHARLRVGGSDATGTDYTWQFVVTSNTTTTATRTTSQTQIAICRDASGGASGEPSTSHIYFYAPALAQTTAIRTLTLAPDSGAVIHDYASTHAVSTSYTGITIIPGSTGTDGTLCIYGLSQ